MNEHEQRLKAARLFLEHCDDVLGVARREIELSPTTSVSRAYYACFYAASAVLVVEGRHFVKHTSVRAAIHRDLVKPGRLSAEIAGQYDQLMEDRGDADYKLTVRFTPDHARVVVARAELVVRALRDLLPPEVR